MTFGNPKTEVVKEVMQVLQYTVYQRQMLTRQEGGNAKMLLADVIYEWPLPSAAALPR